MSHISNRDFLKALATALLALAISAAVLIPTYLALFPTLHPEFADSRERSAKPVTLRGAQFRPVVFGDGGIEGNSAVISQLAEGRPADQAVLLHQRRFSAADYPFLRHHIEGWHPGLRVMLFWRRADDPQTNHYSELDYTGGGAGYFNLLRSEEWRGQIVELAVGFFGDLRGEPVKLHELRLEPYGTGQVLKTIWGEWTTFKVWDQTSINVYRGVAKGALLYPVPAAALWIAIGIALVWLGQLATRRYRGSPLLLTAAIATVTVWILLDGLWLQQLLRQNVETRYLFAGKTLHEKKLADWDGEYYAFAQEIKANLPADRTRISILYTPRESHAMAQRTRLHLLPEHHASWLRPLTVRMLEYTNERYDYLVILTSSGTNLADTPSPLETLGITTPPNAQLLHAQGPAALYRLNKPDPEEVP